MFDSLKLIFLKKAVEASIDKKGQIKQRILRKLHSAETSKCMPEKFDALAREFFTEYFLIKGELTSQEIMKCLQHKKIKKETREKIKLFLDSLETAKFSDGRLTRDECSILKKSFEEIINLL